ncbi:MAG: thiamine-phosphate kinase [Gallionellaceae bacterium]|nr:thiamine-phosphate kinase [Gallionellaceae bacterium]
MSEFDLIRRYFTRATPNTVLGIGDDAALVRINGDMKLAISTDMLVSGTHFFADADPYMLGHKTLAVNLSDMAAMGAQPRWVTLAAALPTVDEAWLAQFSAGFFALADEYQVELIGGDTTRGPLTLCVTILGEVPHGAALRREGAQIGDDIWVSGRLGDAALALAHMQGHIHLAEKEFAACAPALHQPSPRVALGLALRGVAHSVIDISDGLLADLGHILQCSNVGAEIQFDMLPISDVMRTLSRAIVHPSPLGGGVGGEGGFDLLPALAQRCILSGGDDYELCFTVPEAQRPRIEKISTQLNLPLTRIGVIVPGSGCRVLSTDGSIISIQEAGYDHFR